MADNTPNDQVQSASTAPQLDTLRLRGLQFFGRHGTEPWEKEVGRRFTIEVELKLDLSTPAASDNLRDAVDYRAVYAAVRDVVQNESYYLIEAIAGQLIRRLFQQFPTVQALRVQVSKPEAPIGGLNQAAEVVLERARVEGKTTGG